MAQSWSKFDKSQLHSRWSAFKAIAQNCFSPEWSQGWRLTALLAFILALVVLIINSSLVIWYVTSATTMDGIKVLYFGDCHKANQIDTWLHLLINVFSTLLLAGSNFCKCLVENSTAGLDVN